MPEAAVDVVYDGELDTGKWWIVHIEPSGEVNIWRRISGSSFVQRIADAELALTFSTLSRSISPVVDEIIASLNIEGLTRASVPGQVGGVSTLSEITYKVTPVSG